MTASTRRAALGAILAAPLASVPALAASRISADEAGLLAIGPQLVRLLDEYDRAWAPVPLAYADWERAADRIASVRWAEREALPEWHAYMATRAPADVIGQKLDDLYDPYMDVPLASVPAILLRHRVGMTLEHLREDALSDLDRLWREGRACA